MCDQERTTVQKITMAVEDEIAGIEFYEDMLESMSDKDPAREIIKAIIDDERKHAKYFYSELGKYIS